MKWEVAVNVRESITEIIDISKTAVEGGIRRLWIIDFPATRFAPVIASVVANIHPECRIGIGLISPFLHRPSQIVQFIETLISTYGDRFDLLIGPGDKSLLRRVGIDLGSPSTIVDRIMIFSNQIKERLREGGYTSQIWLGAQGPKVIQASIALDGVLLNYSDPEMVKWALDLIRNRNDGFQIGIFPPSQIVEEEDCNEAFMISAAVVMLGVTRSVSQEFGFANLVKEAKKLIRKVGRIDAEIIQFLGEDTLRRFGFCGTIEDLCEYSDSISNLKVDMIVFGPPLGTKMKSVQALVEFLRGLQ